MGGVLDNPRFMEEPDASHVFQVSFTRRQISEDKAAFTPDLSYEKVISSITNNCQE